MPDNVVSIDRGKKAPQLTNVMQYCCTHCASRAFKIYCDEEGVWLECANCENHQSNFHIEDHDDGTENHSS